jgi:hypothetical protein
MDCFYPKEQVALAFERIAKVEMEAWLCSDYFVVFLEAELVGKELYVHLPELY